MTEPKKAVKIEMDPLMHAQVRVVADHYGASVRGTIIRYIREGIEADRRNDVPPGSKTGLGAVQKAPADTQPA